MRGTGASGGSGGISGGGVRGGSAVATRSTGGGIETQSFSGGTSFGNTARFEKSFSGKSLATPKISISKTGSIENSLSKSKTGNSTSKGRVPSLAKSFGPKMEAVRNMSLDTNRPNVSAFKETKPIYTRRAENTSTVVKKSDHPLYSRTRELQVSKPQQHDVYRQHTSWSETRSLYSRPKEQTVKKLPISQPKKEAHPLYTTTRPVHFGEHRMQHAPRVSPITYERNPMKQFTSNDKRIIAPSGEITGMQRSKSAHADRLLSRVEQRTNPKRPVEIIKQKAAKTAQVHEMKKSPQVRAEQAKTLRTLLSSTRPHEIHSRLIQHNLQEKQPIQSQNKKSELRKVVDRPITKEDTAKLLTSYVSLYVPMYARENPQRYASSEQRESGSKNENRSRLRSNGIKLGEKQSTHTTTSSNPVLQSELQADLKQAIRVKAAYQALIGVAKSPGTEKEAERVVLKALDYKLEKSHLKQQLTEQVTSLQTEHISPTETVKEAVTPQSEKKSVVKHDTSLQPDTTEELPLQSFQTVQNEQQVATETQRQRLTEETSSESFTEQVVQLPHASHQTMMIQQSQLLQAETAEDEVATLEDDEYQRILLELRLAYERDVEVDQARLDTAVAVAKATSGKENEPIHGEVFLDTLGQSAVYESLKSPIVGERHPDEYLTEIIEELAEDDYRSVHDVQRKAATLIAQKPAVTLGEVQNVSQQDVEKVKNSIRYPKH